MKRFSGKVAVVIGGGSGMGKATVERLVSEDCRVVVADISGEEGAVAQTYKENVIAVHCDVSQAVDVKNTIAVAMSQFGSLHTLINCSGICESPMPIIRFDEAEFDKTVAVNFKGVVLAMKYGIPAIIKSGGGTVVNVASTSAIAGVAGACAYTGSKGAVIAITRSTALEYAASNVRVNCVVPGMTLTPILRRHFENAQNPDEALRALARENMLGRGADPSELAAPIVFLASQDASYITGATLIVDGGQTAFASVLQNDPTNSLTGAASKAQSPHQADR